MKNGYKLLVAVVSLTVALGAGLAFARDGGAVGAGFGGDFRGLDSFSTADDAARSFDANHPDAAQAARNDAGDDYGYGDGYGGGYESSGPASTGGSASSSGPASRPSTALTAGPGTLVSPGAMPANAATVVVGGTSYRYAGGIFYKPSDNDRFAVVNPPLGAAVAALPNRYYKLDFGAGKPPLYYDPVYGAYYAAAAQGGTYTVVQPPKGTVVPSIPKEFTRFVKDGVEYDQYNGLVYRQYFSGGNVVYAVT